MEGERCANTFCKMRSVAGKRLGVHQVMKCRPSQDSDYIGAQHVFACQYLQERGLASPIGADQQTPRSWRQLEGEITDDRLVPWVSICESIHRNGSSIASCLHETGLVGKRI